MMVMKYIVSFVLLFVLEIIYFRIADKFNIIDRPNERSSHSRIVLRGGGIVFMLSVWVWSMMFGFTYPFMLAAVSLASLISFVDDVHSLSDKLRLIVQFIAMMLLIEQIGLLQWNCWWMAAVALVIGVGATNIYNFMDGINGMTGAYSIAVLLPLSVINSKIGFVDPSLLMVVILGVIVFCIFNLRPKNKAKCFAGDVGSVGMAFIVLFCVGRLVVESNDITWLALLIVYGVDGCLTIVHRIILHENLGQAHRKHAYQIMANELGLSHVVISLLYMSLQLAVSLCMFYFVPDNFTAHLVYLILVALVLCGSYVLFMRKYYHLHEEYLEKVSIKK